MRFVGKLFAAALLAANVAFAGDAWIVTGRVVGILDGDTVTILDRANTQHKIRLSGIDAPERGQAFGERSRQSLAQMTHGKDARIDCHKTDRFGREVCKVWVQPLDCSRCGKTLDVGLAQISVGLAWWFSRYADEQSAEDRGRYKSEEEEARLRKRGLWVDDAPVPQWEWRDQPREVEGHLDLVLIDGGAHTAAQSTVTLLTLRYGLAVLEPRHQSVEQSHVQNKEMQRATRSDRSGPRCRGAVGLRCISGLSAGSCGRTACGARVPGAASPCGRLSALPPLPAPPSRLVITSAKGTRALTAPI